MIKKKYVYNVPIYNIHIILCTIEVTYMRKKEEYSV